MGADKDLPPIESAAIWPHCANMVLGAWLISSPVTMHYQSRGLWWSDIVCGVLVLIFSALSLSQRRLWAPWAASFVGAWLLLAPLIFWAPTAAEYGNDTLVGALVIAFAIIIPGVPGVHELPGPEVPPGWNYNPSSWLQRSPIIALAFVGFFLSRYLAAYQLGHFPVVWDPFFPGGTKQVLESDVSKAFPVSDAGLGAVSYLVEALTGFIGGKRRWRTMPWMVILFGILVVPLGVVSIVLITLQPLAVGAWCTVCLATAAAMLIMISPAMDEVIATCQFLLQSRRAGKPFWRTFWLGGTLDDSAAKVPTRSGSAWSEIASAVGLDSVPWNLVVCAALGVWLMFAPDTLKTAGAAADSDHLLGALIVTVSVIAIGEVARTGRFFNLLLGAWLLAAPWLLAGFTPAARWNDMLLGVALMLLTIPRGKISERFGGWDSWVF